MGSSVLQNAYESYTYHQYIPPTTTLMAA